MTRKSPIWSLIAKLLGGFLVKSPVRQQDVTIAKNYLKQTEVEELNGIVVMYLDYAEDQAKRRKTEVLKLMEVERIELSSLRPSTDVASTCVVP